MGRRRCITMIVLIHAVSINLLFFSSPATQAQGTSRVSTRLTIPVAPNVQVLIENKEGRDSLVGVFSDILSSTKFIMNTDGAIVETAAYYPYGTLLAGQIDRTNRFNRYYTGQRKVTDVDSPIYNYNARYYNPTIGVFTQPDPVDGPNRFAYVAGNPITRNDPTGTRYEAQAGTAPPQVKSRGGYVNVSRRYLGTFNGGSSFKDTTTSFMPSPESLSGDPTFDTALTIGGISLGGGAATAGLIAAGPPVLASGISACLANAPKCWAIIADTLLGASGASPIPIHIATAVQAGRWQRFVADESGQFLPLMGRTSASLELMDVADEVVAGWGAPQLARLKAPPAFRQDLLKILKGESPAVVYAETGRPIAIPQEAINTIAKRLGRKGMQDERLMRQFADTVYQLSQDTHYPGLHTHRIDSLDFISTEINGDWRLAWEWTKMQVLTASGEFEEVSAIQLLSVGQHTGANAIYRP